jgi:hypothetical protein
LENPSRRLLLSTTSHGLHGQGRGGPGWRTTAAASSHGSVRRRLATRPARFAGPAASSPGPVTRKIIFFQKFPDLIYFSKYQFTCSSNNPENSDSKNKLKQAQNNTEIAKLSFKTS